MKICESISLRNGPCTKKHLEDQLRNDVEIFHIYYSESVSDVLLSKVR